MPTASYQKHNDYVEQLAKGVHDWSTHTFKLSAHALASAPVAANAVFADLTEISAGNGYTAGGATLDTVSLTEASGTSKVTIADETITASGGSIATFQYLDIYNDTPTSPADPLVFFLDYGSGLTLANGESLVVDFDGSAGVWTMA